MSFAITGPTPIATPPPPLLAWVQQNPFLVTGVTVFLIMNYAKENDKKRRRKRRRKK